MGDLLGYQVAPYTWSWTGRFAQFLPLQVFLALKCRPLTASCANHSRRS